MEVIGNKKHSTLFKDPEFSTKNTRELFHRIFLNHNEVSGIIYNEGNKVLCIYNYRLQKSSDTGFPVKKVNDIFTSNEQFNPPYKETQLYLSGSGFTLVPSLLYKKENANKLLSFNYILNEGESIMDEHIPDIDSNIIYAYNKDLMDIINSRFSNLKAQNIASLQIPFYLRLSESKSAYVYCQAYHSYFQICIIDKGKLLLYNHFNFSTSEDLLYYIVFCMEQLGLNPEFTKLRIGGKLEKKDSLGLLKDYIRDVETHSFEPKFHSKSILGEIKLNQYLPHLISI